MNIIDLIPPGSSNAVTREYLMRETNMSDRAVRRRIEEARDNGEVIVALSTKGGYFQPVYPNDSHYVEHLVVENQSRANRNLENNTPLKNWLRKYRGEDKIETMQQKIPI